MDWMGWDGMVILYTVTPRASLKSDAKKLHLFIVVLIEKGKVR